MHLDYRNETRRDLEEEVQELETAYAEALGDEVDVHALSELWEQIKRLKGEAGEKLAVTCQK